VGRHSELSAAARAEQIRAAGTSVSLETLDHTLDEVRRGSPGVVARCCRAGSDAFSSPQGVSVRGQPGRGGRNQGTFRH